MVECRGWQLFLILTVLPLLFVEFYYYKFYKQNGVCESKTQTFRLLYSEDTTIKSHLRKIIRELFCLIAISQNIRPANKRTSTAIEIFQVAGCSHFLTFAIMAKLIVCDMCKW